MSWTKKDLILAIEGNIKSNWKNSYLHIGTEVALQRIVNEKYEGRDEDIECILEHLNSVHGAGFYVGKPFYCGTIDGNLSLQDVECILYEDEFGYYCTMLEKVAKELNDYQMWFQQNLLNEDYDTAAICKAGEEPVFDDYNCGALACEWNRLTNDNLDEIDIVNLYSGLFEEVKKDEKNNSR